MIIKIFLVAIFIVLSWNTIKVSESNALLQAQLTELKNHSEEITKSVLSNNNLLAKQGQTIDRNSNLSDLNKSLLLKMTKVEGALTSLSKQSNSKKSFEQLNETLKKQTKSIEKHTNSISTLKICKDVNTQLKNPVYKKSHTKITKPKATKTLNKIFSNFYDTKEQYHNKNYKRAIDRLSKLKSEVWSIRDLEIVSKAKVMEVLSAIDITKKKWETSKTDYDLSYVASKINLLAPNTNTIGACK